MPITKTAGEDHLIQIRFADTPEQKALKQQTTAARQYRTAEYESQTHGGSFPGSRLNSMSSSGQVASGGFESYMNMNGYVCSRPTQHTATDQADSHYPQYPPHPIVGLVGRFAARDRLYNVSSHLAQRQESPGVQVNFPTNVKAESEDPATAVDEKHFPGSTASDKLSDQSAQNSEVVA